MKKFIVLLLLVPFFTLFAQDGAPKISVSEETYNFGDINVGDKVSHDFTITNTGNAVLKITKVKASCGCTAAAPEKNELKPGESTSINVEFNSARRSGKQRKHVYVFSNDPDKPQLRLSFTTNILTQNVQKAVSKGAPRMNLEVSQHNFKNVVEGTVAKETFRFKNTGKTALLIEDIKTSCECTKVSLESKIYEPGEIGELKVEFDTKDRSGKMSRTIVIKTNDPVTPEQIITLFINIEPRTS